MKALITGASSGIGRDMAFVLADMGYDLILTARREDRMEEIKRSVKTNVFIIPLDLSYEKNCLILYDKTKNEDIDILVNNAGFGIFGEFYKTDLYKELEMINLNIKALHILTKLYLPKMMKNNKGIIINVASSAAFLPGPLLSSYYASKAYVLRLSQAVNKELSVNKSKVRIATLCPGPVATEFDATAGVSFSIKGLSSRFVAEYAIKKALKGKNVIIPGNSLKIARLLSKIFPDKILLNFVYRIQHNKKQ